MRAANRLCVAGRWIRPSCIVLLVGAWILDMFTPQRFVVAILLNAPIALSSLALDSRFTQVLVALALVANVVAGYYNGVVAGHQWDLAAVGDRIIAGFSFLLVGGLSIAAQRSALHAGELAARQDRAARERGVRRAVEAIRSSVNAELIGRAVVREAGEALGVDAARLYVFNYGLAAPTTYASAERGEVEVSTLRPPAAILSFVQRVADAREIDEVRETDALGRLLIDTLGLRFSIAAPLVEHGSLFGVLVLSRREQPFESQFHEGLQVYVDQAAIALAQSALFVQLADRNEELAQANEALRERNDVIRDIVYALSHDLRTPLTAAGLTMRQALDGAYGSLPPSYREILRRSLESNDQLQSLAETLLMVSRYESGENSMRRERVGLLRVASGVVDELSPLWRGKELDVEADGDGGLAIMADPGELRRALINVVANAVAFTPSHGRIDVHVGANNGAAQVRVEDTGFGVPEAERAHLFERISESAGRPGAGSGLGLYLARRVVESHGGQIAYAPRPEHGSIFTLTFPRVDGAVAG